jgi:hypothetical protein
MVWWHYTLGKLQEQMGNLRKRVRLVSNSETSISVMCTTVFDKNWHHMTLMISCSYAIESIHDSCNYAYKDVEQDITLGGKQSIYIYIYIDIDIDITLVWSEVQNYMAISCFVLRNSTLKFHILGCRWLFLHSIPGCGEEASTGRHQISVDT